MSFYSILNIKNLHFNGLISEMGSIFGVEKLSLLSLAFNLGHQINLKHKCYEKKFTAFIGSRRAYGHAARIPSGTGSRDGRGFREVLGRYP